MVRGERRRFVKQMREAAKPSRPPAAPSDPEVLLECVTAPERRPSASPGAAAVARGVRPAPADDGFPVEDRAEVSVGKTPYVRFDRNDYSVPHERVRRALVVLATQDTVRVLDGNEVVDTHPRSWGKGKQIGDPAHIAALVERKREAREARGMDRLHHAVPETRAFLVAVAERGGNLGSTTNGLLKLLDAYGAEYGKTDGGGALG